MHSTSSPSLPIHIAIVDIVDSIGNSEVDGGGGGGDLPKGNCGANVRLQFDDQTDGEDRTRTLTHVTICSFDLCCRVLCPLIMLPGSAKR